MQLKQRLGLKKLLLPQLQQSLNILTLPVQELRNLVAEELVNNPFLEEPQSNPPPSFLKNRKSSLFQGRDTDFKLSLITKKTSLQDILLRQLGMFSNTDEELKIGQEIIGNIDDNGYLKIGLEDIAAALAVPLDRACAVLKLIQQFDPPGVGARTVSECLLIQLRQAGEKNPLIMKIAESYLDDLAKKNYSRIAKTLKEPLDNVKSCAQKIVRLNPKPGRNYSPEQAQNIIPDVIIEESGDELETHINNEDIPTLHINQEYKKILKDTLLDPKTKEFLKAKLQDALELTRFISKRQYTLRKIVDAILEIQADALKEDFSRLKPLTFQEIAQKTGMHESTVCRVIMNKYAQTPNGLIALKDLFSSHVHHQDGRLVSSNFVKHRIKELTDSEDKKHPLSDQEISAMLSKENELKVSRRAIAKYRQGLRILSTAFRRER